jgi:hypothetical protein
MYSLSTAAVVTGYDHLCCPVLRVLQTYLQLAVTSQQAL